jgi:hypothetical protein
MHDYYQVTNDNGQEARFTTLQYSFYAGEPEKHTAVFYRFGDRQKMQNEINQYVEGLTSCYDDGAFCDTKQDITVYSYQVSEGFLLHKITLKYDTFNLKDVENATGKDINTLVIGGAEVLLQPGDTYVADEWNATPEYRLNQKTYGTAAVTGRGITTKDNLDKVAAAYNIKAGYALWDVELDPKNDGNLSIETREYVPGEFDTTGVQKATLIIAYYRLEGQWVPLTYDEINQYIAYVTGEGSEKPYDGIMMYHFQFPYNGASGNIDDGMLATFSIDYEPQP